uniref:DUF1618 domain-containing protein n=1 Tax=Aegilops tauschii subsp. strangulata TaxID=200361 RepID=A0A453CZT2_AEGTS
PSYNIDVPRSADDPKIYRHLSAEEFRSMACVGDTIKLVCVDGNVFQVPGKSFDLTVYALSDDLSEWTIDRKYNVGNIWASEAYHSTGMPNLAPLFPVLSINEDDVIYLVFTPLKLVDDRAECTSQYLIRVDMKNNKVQLYPQSTESRIHSQVLASEISAYQQHLQDHPREIEATELGASGKRLRL